jgi:hypothetical protein
MWASFALALDDRLSADVKVTKVPSLCASISIVPLKEHDPAKKELRMLATSMLELAIGLDQS